MSRAALKATRTTVYRWIALQSVAVVIISIIFFLWQGLLFAASVLLGGAMCILPNSLFALWWFRAFRAKAARRLAIGFCLGEFLKLFFIALLFVLAQRLLAINILAALIGFMSAQIAFWVAPFLSCSFKERNHAAPH